MVLRIKMHTEDLPATSELMIWSRFIELTGVHPSRLGELIELGWLCPNRTQGESYLFHPNDVYKVTKLERICNDFEIPALAGTIIIDLMERIEDLELQVRDLRRLL